MIPGILFLQTRQSYGVIGNTKRLFIFQSFDGEHKGLVCTSLHTRYNRNQFISVIPATNQRDERITYVIHTHHGCVDEPKAFMEAMFVKYELNKKKTRPIQYPIHAISYDELFPVKTSNVPIFTIDPSGCTDIDDAISYDENSNTIGIHITYIGHFLSQHIRKMTNYTSLYPENMGVIHMLPEKYSTDSFSLLKKKERRVISLYLTEDSSPEWKLEKIKVRNNYSYDEQRASHYFNSERMKKMNRIILKLNRVNDDDIELFKNTKELIECVALFYNKYAAEHLVSKGVIPIIREQIMTIDDYDNDRLIPATYNWWNRNSFHHSLNLAKYGHFTSPIRRAVDIYNQHLLASILSNGNIPEPSVSLIPSMVFMNRKIANGKKAMSSIYMYQCFHNDTLPKYTDSKVINFDDSSICLWVPVLKKHIYVSHIPWFVKNNWISTYIEYSPQLCYEHTCGRTFKIEKNMELRVKIMKDANPYPRVMLVPEFLLVQQDSPAPSPPIVPGIVILDSDSDENYDLDDLDLDI